MLQLFVEASLLLLNGVSIARANRIISWRCWQVPNFGMVAWVTPRNTTISPLESSGDHHSSPCHRQIWAGLLVSCWSAEWKPVQTREMSFRPMVTVSLSTEHKQVSACGAEWRASKAVQYLTWSKAPFPVHIHFILWPCKSHFMALATAGKSTTTLHKSPQPKTTRRENTRGTDEGRSPNQLDKKWPCHYWE